MFCRSEIPRPALLTAVIYCLTRATLLKSRGRSARKPWHTSDLGQVCYKCSFSVGVLSLEEENGASRFCRVHLPRISEQTPIPSNEHSLTLRGFLAGWKGIASAVLCVWESRAAEQNPQQESPGQRHTRAAIPFSSENTRGLR